ncbi:unnamed protein product [Scytosiphon promiscuus]
MSVEDDEPGEPGKIDDDGKPYFFPGNQQRPADAREQRDGFVPRWEYSGHSSGSIRSIQATGRDAFDRIRFVSTGGGTSIHSWLEGGEGDSAKMTCSEHMINALTFVSALNVVAAASEDKLLIFDGRTMRCLNTLSTSKKVLLQLQYNRARDEIISGGSDGCFVWKLAAIPCELSSLDALLFELTMLHGLKGSSSWAGNMVWDEASQVILTIDGTRVKTHVASTLTTTKGHTINRAHESPVTVGLWIHESENIVTGCMGGDMKIWACQHSDVTGAKRDRLLRRHKNKRTRSRRRGYRQQPALVKSFGAHCGSITGLVRHSLNSSYVISSGADGMLRVWDVDRLCAVTNVLLPYKTASLWTTCLDGESRLLCAGSDGGIRTMVLRQVSQPLSFDPDGAHNVRYFPPVRGDADAARGVTPDDEHARHDGEGHEQHGLILVQKKHGLWGLMSESLLLPTSAQRKSDSTEGVVSLETGDGSRATVGHPLGKVADQGGSEGEASEVNEDTTSSLFFAWPPLSSVVERYSHHVLSRRRRKVICLADPGVMDIYHFGPVNGEARKLSSRKVDLHSNGATSTCMCLLPDTPTCIEASLDRFFASSSRVDANLDRPVSGDADVWSRNGDVVGDKNRGGMGGEKGAHRIAREEKDQVVAIGTSHGGLVLVETVIGGTTLDYLEGVFASGVSHVAFCEASSDDAIRSDGATLDTERCAPFATDSECLVCAGYDAHGTMTIKGLSASSFMEKFSLRLVENPTHVRVASRRPIVAIGYADGALNVIHFGQGRVHDLNGSDLVGAHRTQINTIAFSTRHRCMASGSVDGYIVIWDLHGQKLHTIYLQTPALAVEFMEVSAELLVSSSSGMSRIPPCQWCPRRLLVANERREGTPGAQLKAWLQHVVPSSRRRHVEHKDREVGGSSDSLRDCRSTGQEQAQIWRNTITGSHGKGRVISNRKGANDCGWEQDRRSGAVAGQEGTPLKTADSSAPSRLQKLSPPKGGDGSLKGTCISPKRAYHEKISILDRMSAKFTSMPASPPPSLRATKRPTCIVHTTPPGSRSPLDDRSAVEEAKGKAAAVAQCAREDGQPIGARGPTIETSTTPPLTETNSLDPGTTPVSDGTPVTVERGVAFHGADEVGTTNEKHDQQEEGCHLGDRGGSGVGIDIAVSSSMESSASDCSPPMGTFFDGDIPYLLEQPAAMPWRSTHGQTCVTPLGHCPGHGAPDAEEAMADTATGDADKPLVKGRERPVLLKTTARQRLARDASSSMKPRVQKACTERAHDLASTTFAISGRAVAAAPSAGLRPAEKLHCFVQTNETRTDSLFFMPSTPACYPPPWGEAHDVPLAISPYPNGGRRRERLVLASTPPTLGGGIGAGTAAAIAAKDVHNVVPPTSTSRAITKPVVVRDLGSSVPRPPLSPSPQMSGTGSCRAFGVISPRLWSEGGANGCRASLATRLSDGDGSTWTPTSHKGDGTSRGCGDRKGQQNSVPVPGSTNSSFFPVRPRPGRSIPVLRNREQTAPQS